MITKQHEWWTLVLCRRQTQLHSLQYICENVFISKFHSSFIEIKSLSLPGKGANIMLTIQASFSSLSNNCTKVVQVVFCYDFFSLALVVCHCCDGWYSFGNSIRIYLNSETEFTHKHLHTCSHILTSIPQFALATLWQQSFQVWWHLCIVTTTFYLPAWINAIDNKCHCIALAAVVGFFLFLRLFA